MVRPFDNKNFQSFAILQRNFFLWKSNFSKIPLTLEEGNKISNIKRLRYHVFWKIFVWFLQIVLKKYIWDYTFFMHQIFWSGKQTLLTDSRNLKIIWLLLKSIFANNMTCRHDNSNIAVRMSMVVAAMPFCGRKLGHKLVAAITNFSLKILKKTEPIMNRKDYSLLTLDEFLNFITQDPTPYTQHPN